MKELLPNRILSLPTILVGTEAQDHEIIEENNGLVHFKITKEWAEDPNSNRQMTIYSMSVSGPKKDRLDFIRRISQRFGKPRMTIELPQIPNINFCIWHAKELEERLRKLVQN